jgi:hypothetical protein
MLGEKDTEKIPQYLINIVDSSPLSSSSGCSPVPSPIVLALVVARLVLTAPLDIIADHDRQRL